LVTWFGTGHWSPLKVDGAGPHVNPTLDPDDNLPTPVLSRKVDAAGTTVSSSCCVFVHPEDPVAPTSVMVGSFPACSLLKEGRFTGPGTMTLLPFCTAVPGGCGLVGRVRSSIPPWVEEDLERVAADPDTVPPEYMLLGGDTTAGLP